MAALSNIEELTTGLINLKMKNIVIVGQGAIGFLWLSHLQKIADVDVSLRASTDSWKNQSHYSFSHYNGYSEQADFVYANDVKIKQADIIMFCLKAYQIKNAVASLSTLISPVAPLLLCHNGMGVIEQVNSLTLTNPILTLLTTHGCMKASPLHAVHTGIGHSDLGNSSSSTLNQVPQETLLNLCQKALPTVTWQDNIIEKQWQKLAINCVINPITAMYNIINGDIQKTVYRKLIQDIINEIVAVVGVECSKTGGSKLFLQNEFTREKLLATVLTVAEATKNNCSSMRADILAKKPTEIDYINGYIVQLAQKNSLKAPINEMLWQAIQQR